MTSGPFHFLTPEYLRRLRRTVNPQALEQFLAAIPAEVRTAATLTFVHGLTADDLHALNAQLPADDRLGELDGLVKQAPLFATVPNTAYVVQMQAPRDAALLALWRPIEPGFTDRDRPQL